MYRIGHTKAYKRFNPFRIFMHFGLISFFCSFPQLVDLKYIPFTLDEYHTARIRIQFFQYKTIELHSYLKCQSEAIRVKSIHKWNTKPIQHPTDFRRPLGKQQHNSTKGAQFSTSLPNPGNDMIWNPTPTRIHTCRHEHLNTLKTPKHGFESIIVEVPFWKTFLLRSTVTNTKV